jgi:hypothetical protein
MPHPSSTPSHPCSHVIRSGLRTTDAMLVYVARFMLHVARCIIHVATRVPALRYHDGNETHSLNGRVCGLEQGARRIVAYGRRRKHEGFRLRQPVLRELRCIVRVVRKCYDRRHLHTACIVHACACVRACACVCVRAHVRKPWHACSVRTRACLIVGRRDEVQRCQLVLAQQLRQ